jgi:glycosyltransferase involved in cell wall biosynthesis
MKKIIVRGPALSRSGYGEQTRFALRCLRASKAYDIHIINTDWGKTSYISCDDEEFRWIEQKMLTTKKILDLAEQTKVPPKFDVSLQVTIPNEWQHLAETNIGYTAGIESDRVAPIWLEKANKMDKIIVTSNHAKYGFINTSYKGKHEHTGKEAELKLDSNRCSIKVVNYAVREIEKINLDLQFETKTNFLCVAQWGPRKNVENTVKWFVENFKDDEQIGLVLKLNCVDSSVIDRFETEKRINNFLKEIKEDVKCKVYLIHGDMTEQELHSLYVHPKISAMISLTHGEGYGLPLFEAAYNELPIIAPDWSGHMDFLVGEDSKGRSKPLFLNVDFALGNVQKEAIWKGVVQEDSKWCYPQEYSFKKRLNDFVKNEGAHKKRAKSLASQIKQNFSEEKIFKEFVDALNIKLIEHEGSAEEVFVV